ncbi:MAG: hypothetical protein GC179_15295 [Anaerolineaceae bacterium]|nr:hypothetical protein [Anaerolineaceae bacterium]
MAVSGRPSTTALDSALTFALIVCAIWVIPTEIFSLVHTLRTNNAYTRLVRDGILINGQIFEIRVREQRPRLLGSWLNKPQEKGLYFVDYIYKFTSPDEHLIFGKQTIVRPYKYLNDQILPPDGTPIRVLYADNNTHVML